MDDVKVVMFDLDGTIYLGNQIINGANETINFFREKKIKVYFTTNNSTKTRREIYQKLLRMGVDCRLQEVITSGYLAACYAKKMKMKDIYIFGSLDLIEEFNDQGVDINQEENAENLLIGYNPKMSYDDLIKAVNVALGAKTIMACNREKVFPGENRRILPGCGAMTAPIEWCANRQCDVVIGKPNTLMVEMIVEHDKIETSQILVIGDTYESDIAMAFNAGCKSILISKEKKHNSITLSNISDVPNFLSC